MSDPIAAARAMLPGWVVWSPLVAVPIAAALTAPVAIVAWLWGRQRLARIPAGVHWSERARAAWPVRRAAIFFPLVFPAATVPLVIGGAIARVPWGIRLLLVVGASLAVCLPAAFAMENSAVRPYGSRDRLRSLATWVVVAATGWAAAMGYVAARLGSRNPWETALASIVVTLCAVLPVGRRIARSAGLLRPAGPRVTAAVERASAAAGRTPPAAYEAAILSANAFALPTEGAVVVTEGALAALDDDALAAVMAHELHHLQEGRSVKAVRAVNAALGPVILVVVAGGHVAETLPLVWVAWFAWFVGSRRYLRRAEVGADAAARAEGAQYARALEALYERNLVPAHHKRPLSHPHLYDRLVAAGVPPAWPRPAPPSGGAIVLVAVLCAVAVLAGAATFARTLLDPRSHPLLATAVGGGASELTELGSDHLRRRDVEGALLLYRAGERLHPDCPDHPAAIAYALAAAGRCAEGLPYALRALTLDGGAGRVDAWVEPFFERCGKANRSQNAPVEEPRPLP